MKHFIGFELVWLVVSYVLACAIAWWTHRNKDYVDKDVIKGVWFIQFFLGTGIYLLIK